MLAAHNHAIAPCGSGDPDGTGDAIDDEFAPFERQNLIFAHVNAFGIVNRGCKQHDGPPVKLVLKYWN